MESDIDVVYSMYFRIIPKENKWANLITFSPFKIQALILWWDVQLLSLQVWAS